MVSTMPAGLIRVTPEMLQATSTQFNQGAASIDATLKQLNGQVNSLGNDWAGTGQVRFAAAFAQWQSAQVNLHQALETIAMLTSRAASSYTLQDDQVGASFGQLA